MANYDDLDVTLTLSYKDWQLVGHCLKHRRDDVLDNADRIEIGDCTGTPEQLQGLRRKATAIFVVKDELEAALADARRSTIQERAS